ncbi:MAG: ATP-binding protein [Treponema sp.]|jgi:predicted ATP-binding protein involved in virulence|nr:ATP-binding protein [Treponema sp.]
MEKWIKSISGVIPHTNKTVDIELEGRNLIITGANGSGKTSLLRAVYEKVDLLIVGKKIIDLFNYKRLIGQFQKEIKNIEDGIMTNIPDYKNFISIYEDRKAIICFFEEKRLSEIAVATFAKGLSIEEEDAKKQNKYGNLGNNLEQHLVNLMNRQSLAITKDKNQELANKIETWFSEFENNLKVLFEDDTLKLEFDSDSFKFSIRQDSKPSYTFQTLSAGYRAIFDIYAELIMRTEYFKVLPKDLTGIVFIDEIDSHLHVSLQRLILPFFINSFPKIQFIVTTHSPFVLMSTPDTVVFDLAKNEPITEDLSYYTYSSIMKGLWNVKPISVSLEREIMEIAQIVNSDSKNYKRLAELVKKIKGREDGLDSESKVFFLRGFETLEEAGKDV